jgi:hypothetical protein
MVWSALSSVQQVNKANVSFRVLSVCSTTRSLRPCITKLFKKATAHLRIKHEGTNAAEVIEETAEQKFVRLAEEELLDGLIS